eukprot:65065-Alexandrium_andersonii.AAC.1
MHGAVRPKGRRDRLTGPPRDLFSRGVPWGDPRAPTGPFRALGIGTRRQEPSPGEQRARGASRQNECSRRGDREMGKTNT